MRLQLAGGRTSVARFALLAHCRLPFRHRRRTRAVWAADLFVSSPVRELRVVCGWNDSQGPQPLQPMLGNWREVALASWGKHPAKHTGTDGGGFQSPNVATHRLSVGIPHVLLMDARVVHMINHLALLCMVETT